MEISEKELKASLDRTEQRRVRAKEIRRRQMRGAALGVVIVLVVLGALLLGVTAGSGPGAPPLLLAVTWPHGETEAPLAPQHVKSGATLLFKSGQAIKVTLPEPEKWNAHWTTPDVTNDGDAFDWTPSGQESTLTARVRAETSGSKKLLSWLWPAREITLRGVAGQTPKDKHLADSGFVHEIAAPESGVWLHFRTMARKATVRFDDRGVKAFGEAAAQLGAPTANAATAESEVWQLVPSFTGGETMSPDDTGTNAVLKTAHPAADAKRAFKILDRLAPKATIKVVVEEGTSEGAAGAVGEARFRLAFDDKGKRYEWVQKPGAEKAEPQDWLKEGPGE